MEARGEETPSVHGSGEPVATKLRRLAEKARKEPTFKFTSLFHLMNEELLREKKQRGHPLKGLSRKKNTSPSGPHTQNPLSTRH